MLNHTKETIAHKHCNIGCHIDIIATLKESQYISYWHSESALLSCWGSCSCPPFSLWSLRPCVSALLHFIQSTNTELGHANEYIFITFPVLCLLTLLRSGTFPLFRMYPCSIPRRMSARGGPWAGLCFTTGSHSQYIMVWARTPDALWEDSVTRSLSIHKAISMFICVCLYSSTVWVCDRRNMRLCYIPVAADGF